MSQTADITPLLSLPRETYLRQHEARIRSAAASVLAAGPDTSIRSALDAVIYAEDLFDIHDVAATHYRNRDGQQHRATTHARHAAAAMQLKLRALDQLAHLVV